MLHGTFGKCYLKKTEKENLICQGSKIWSITESFLKTLDFMFLIPVLELKMKLIQLHEGRKQLTKLYSLKGLHRSLDQLPVCNIPLKLSILIP